ncbi:MAG: DUF2723 domain-containing protein, partial [Anaerolineae bacterium]|nr:DUF2723 domain-containing protein [Anaerolineae bacterium]
MTLALPRHRLRPRDLQPLALTLLALVLIYAPTLLTHPGSGENPYMDDVGEIQVALNVWGTIHLTGYPLYTMLGSAAVAVMRAVGVAPILAPVLYSLGWGLIVLSLFYLLVLRLTGRVSLAVAGTLILGLVRSVWIHNVIAEVYSMTLAIQIMLLILALWSPVTVSNARNRVLWMALVGGVGVAHHRMIAFMAPGLLLAVAPGWFALRPTRRIVVTSLAAVPLALIGFLPYLYLPARALAGGIWIYGDPSTLAGLWHEFSGAEVAYLMRLPADAAALLGDALR